MIKGYHFYFKFRSNHSDDKRLDVITSREYLVAINYMKHFSANRFSAKEKGCLFPILQSQIAVVTYAQVWIKILPFILLISGLPKKLMWLLNVCLSINEGQYFYLILVLYQMLNRTQQNVTFWYYQISSKGHILGHIKHIHFLY